jgi:hypothetical protein
MKIGLMACASLALASLVANPAGAQTKGEMWAITTQMNIPGMPAGMGAQTQRLCQGDDPERAADNQCYKKADKSCQEHAKMFPEAAKA